MALTERQQEEYDRLNERIGKGIEWLTERDPRSVFHFWFRSGITPTMPMPAQDDETRARYAEYYPARVTFERLMDRAVALDRLAVGTP